MTQHDANTIRILIADDDAQTRESLKKLLSSESDFKVVGTASNGRQCSRLTQHHLPDVVLVGDTIILDEFEIISMISKMYPGIMIIVLSESNSRDALQKSLLSGARAATSYTDRLIGLIFSLYRSEEDRRNGKWVTLID